MNPLKIYNKFNQFPLGKNLFSFFFCMKAPYFMSIRPQILDYKAGHAAVKLKQRWAIQNHIQTVHAIAVCNLIEMCMGLVAESTIPSHLRWLPMGMDVDYLKKMKGTLTATATLDVDTFFFKESYPAKVAVPVEVRNEAGEVVSTAQVRLWITKKPEQKK